MKIKKDKKEERMLTWVIKKKKIFPISWRERKKRVLSNINNNYDEIERINQQRTTELLNSKGKKGER